MRGLAFWFLASTLLAAPRVNAQESTPSDPIEHAIRATLRISEGSTSATGFVVDLGANQPTGERYALVTAAHAFDEANGLRCTLHFRVPDEERGFARKETELTIREGDRPLWTGHGAADVAAIFIELPPKVDVEPFELRHIADETWFDERRVRTGQVVRIPCFPAKVESNSAGFPIVRSGAIATHPLTMPLVGQTMLIDYSNFGGDSGAAVTAIIDDEPIVIGIATASLRQTDASTSDFEDRTTHMPLGLSVTVRSVLILETLDRLRSSP